MTRVRFAPSPTGFLHIGGLRTALYNFLFARKNNGVFILRIEDTDQTRTVSGGLENILKTLQMIGLEYDEGPYLENYELRIKNQGNEGKIIEKGDHGSYIQSKRLEIYKKYAEELIKKDRAYYCFCSSERLESLRQKQIASRKPSMYDGLCKTLSREEINQKLTRGEKAAIRLNVPDSGETTVKDIIHGEIKFQNSLLDDQVLLKSDSFPTYHLANVVDDHLMKITHIIRGEEWLPSTPKHLLLYEAFDWTPPQFAHLPLLLNSDRSKLSKRQGDVAVEDYLNKGYLPEALLNFVALLGWNPSGERETYTLDELIKEFDLTGVNKSGAIFNQEKLNWLNGYYIRKKTLTELTDLALSYLEGAGFIKAAREKYKVQETGENLERGQLEAIVASEQERILKLSDIIYGTEFFFKEKLDYPAELLIWRKDSKKKTKNNLIILNEFLRSLKEADFTVENLEEKIKAWIKENKLDNGSVLHPMRVALSGRESSPPPFDIAAILGKGRILKRLKYAISLLI